MDPATEPDLADHVEQKARDLDKARQLTVGSMPMVEPPSDGKVDLSLGLWDGTVHHTDAEVRELNGADEEALAKYTEPVEMFDAVLCRATVRIGSINLSDLPMSERQSHLAQLLVGDRELLFINIIAATYGNERTVPFICPTCEASSEVDILFNQDFKPTTDETPKTNYEFVSSKGDRITFRLVTGVDQLGLARRRGVTKAEANSYILSECIINVNGEVPFDPMQYVRDMSMRDRGALLESLNEHQPNLDTVFKFNCPSCGNEVHLPLDWGDMFQL